jgi:hypothetical protein
VTTKPWTPPDTVTVPGVTAATVRGWAAVPEAGIVTCSEYVPGLTFTDVPGVATATATPFLPMVHSGDACVPLFESEHPAPPT